MNVLPWLLDWPPRRASVGLFLVLTAFSVGTLALFGGVTDEITDGSVTVEATDFSVRLNDDIDPPDAEAEGVQTCLGSGTPGDSIAVLGDVTLDVPPEAERDAGDERRLVVEVSVAGETTTTTVERTGRPTIDVFWVLTDDETLAVGDTARLRVRVRDGDSTVANATEAVTVENASRSYDC